MAAQKSLDFLENFGVKVRVVTHHVEYHVGHLVVYHVVQAVAHQVVNVVDQNVVENQDTIAAPTVSVPAI